MIIGTELVLKNCETGEIVEGTIDDVPDDSTTINVEAIVVEGGEEIAYVEEATGDGDPDTGWDRPCYVRVGWHILVDDRRFEVISVGGSCDAV